MGRDREIERNLDGGGEVRVDKIQGLRNAMAGHCGAEDF